MSKDAIIFGVFIYLSISLIGKDEQLKEKDIKILKGHTQVLRLATEICRYTAEHKTLCINQRIIWSKPNAILHNPQH